MTGEAHLLSCSPLNCDHIFRVCLCSVKPSDDEQHRTWPPPFLQHLLENSSTSDTKGRHLWFNIWAMFCPATISLSAQETERETSYLWVKKIEWDGTKRRLFSPPLFPSRPLWIRSGSALEMQVSFWIWNNSVTFLLGALNDIWWDLLP